MQSLRKLPFGIAALDRIQLKADPQYMVLWFGTVLSPATQVRWKTGDRTGFQTDLRLSFDFEPASPLDHIQENPMTERLSSTTAIRFLPIFAQIEKDLEKLD